MKILPGCIASHSAKPPIQSRAEDMTFRKYELVNSDLGGAKVAIIADRLSVASQYSTTCLWTNRVRKSRHSSSTCQILPNSIKHFMHSDPLFQTDL